jgi:hypothetical protein
MPLTQKQRISARIKESNDRVKNGLPPDPWVVEYRIKNNKIKANWKAKQPRVPHKPKIANAGSFKAGQVPHNKKTEEELAASKARWKEGTRAWHKENQKATNERQRIKRQTDASFRIKCNLRKRLSTLLCIHKTRKSEQTMDLLGCEFSFFMDHLRGLFKEGMTFENYGEWHIDHIAPCDSFDLTIKEQREACFNYKNLQPLWAIENRIKSNKRY